MYPGARWLKDPELVEAVRELVETRYSFNTDRQALMDVIFDSDSRLSRVTDSLTRADSEWVFEPTGVQGYPDLIAAYALGYDNRQEEVTDHQSNGTTKSPQTDSDQDDKSDGTLSHG